MSSDLLIALVFGGLGIVLLVAEIFLPSHGVLTVLALGSLAGGIYSAFHYSTTFGYAFLVLTLLFLPIFAIVAIRLWPRTFVGRRVAPPNREFRYTESPASGNGELVRLIGQTGVTLTPLRPVGQCDFGGRRVECHAESGMIDRDTRVVAIGVRGWALVVRQA
jgi:membrane-bound ClpP family serine protease